MSNCLWQGRWSTPLLRARRVLTRIMSHRLSAFLTLNGVQAIPEPVGRAVWSLEHEHECSTVCWLAYVHVCFTSCVSPSHSSRHSRNVRPLIWTWRAIFTEDIEHIVYIAMLNMPENMVVFLTYPFELYSKVNPRLSRLKKEELLSHLFYFVVIFQSVCN